jgi:hypothetical protein
MDLICQLIMERVEYSLHDMRASNENLRTPIKASHEETRTSPKEMGAMITASHGGMRAIQ